MSGKVNVLLKNDNFIVVNKPHDLVINSNSTDRISLHKQLVETFPNSVNSSLKFGFYFPHRLDFATSGVMCVALNKKACAAACSTFENRTSRKLYLALVRGHVSQPFIEVDVPIGTKDEHTDKDGPLVMSGNGFNSRPAVSRVIVLDRGLYGKYPATKLLLQPLTGRRHQLRVHCQLLGHTIVGDFTYSNKKDIVPPRMFLHSYSLFLPNSLGELDVKTNDPFIEDLLSDWTVVEKCQPLNNNTMSLIKNESLWKCAVTSTINSGNFNSNLSNHEIEGK